MKDVTLNNGTIMSDRQFIQERGDGDVPSEFNPTQEDLESLADQILFELLADEFFQHLQYSWKFSFRVQYTFFRFERVLDFLPQERIDFLVKKLHFGRSKFPELERMFCRFCDQSEHAVNLAAFVRLAFYSPTMLRCALDVALEAPASEEPRPRPRPRP
jgi:hypothetical protein